MPSAPTCTINYGSTGDDSKKLQRLLMKQKNSENMNIFVQSCSGSLLYYSRIVDAAKALPRY
jgi:hypothetical protein